MHFNTSRRIDSATLHVDGAARPGWISGVERCPTVGEEIFCAHGVAEVIRVLGKTGDGSRLLELRLSNNTKTPPFFAAASNVLVAPAHA